MASKARPGQTDITAGMSVSPQAAELVNRLINARARAAGVTARQYLTGMLSGEFPPLRPAEIAAINLSSQKWKASDEQPPG